ncbi:CcmD family protein [Bernardetia sp. ABR2-2B]|uniref:CcmD family protein n=1 Tax=Bernardetia sp. ABR2-2B TaxID=3127472 RepID=UPI0030D0E30D
MKNIYLLLLIFSFAFLPFAAIAQAEKTDQTETTKNGKIPVTQRDYENTEVAMADTFREDGKIYVVVAVLATIFAGIVVFLVVTESKLKKLEDLVYSERKSKETTHKVL